MKQRNWSVKIKALLLVVVMMFALASNAFAAGKWVENISSANTPTIYVYAKKGQYLAITNCGERNLQIYNGILIGRELAPHTDSLYRAPKTGTYAFKFQATSGSGGRTTYAYVSGGTSFKSGGSNQLSMTRVY